MKMTDWQSCCKKAQVYNETVAFAIAIALRFESLLDAYPNSGGVPTLPGNVDDAGVYNGEPRNQSSLRFCSRSWLPRAPGTCPLRLARLFRRAQSLRVRLRTPSLLLHRPRPPNNRSVSAEDAFAFSLSFPLIGADGGTSPFADAPSLATADGPENDWTLWPRSTGQLPPGKLSCAAWTCARWAGEPGFFGSYGFGKWAGGAGEARPIGIMHELGQFLLGEGFPVSGQARSLLGNRRRREDWAPAMAGPTTLTY